MMVELLFFLACKLKTTSLHFPSCITLRSSILGLYPTKSPIFLARAFGTHGIRGNRWWEKRAKSKPFVRKHSWHVSECLRTYVTEVAFTRERQNIDIHINLRCKNTAITDKIVPNSSMECFFSPHIKIRRVCGRHTCLRAARHMSC